MLPIVVNEAMLASQRVLDGVVCACARVEGDCGDDASVLDMHRSSEFGACDVERQPFVLKARVW